MRTITSFFLVVILAASFGIWRLNLDTHAQKSQIKNAEKIGAALKAESVSLNKYKDGKSLPLDRFYLEVFNDIKEISFYYHTDSEIRIIEAKDLVDTEEFFRPSEYKGIRYVDILCKTNVKDPLDMYLFEVIHKVIKNKPIEILNLRIEKDVLNLTMRLYGP